MSPPLSSADRKKKFIEKLKSTGNYNAFKQKRADYEKVRRQRLKESLAKMSDSQRMKALRHGRLKSLARVQKYREKKKQISDTNEGHPFDAPLNSKLPNPSRCKKNEEGSSLQEPTEQSDTFSCKIYEFYSPKSSNTKINFEHSYTTSSALAKAVTKARQALPTSPSKRKAVIAKLVYALDDKSQKEIFQNKAAIRRTGHKRIGPNLIQQIHKFYERDDISRLSTNVDDLTNFIDPITGEEQLIQLRYLVYTLKQAYDLFMKENAGATVKLSKFCSLRPAYVKLCNKDFDVTSILQIDFTDKVSCDSEDEDESDEPIRAAQPQTTETKPSCKKLRNSFEKSFVTESSCNSDAVLAGNN